MPQSRRSPRSALGQQSSRLNYHWGKKESPIAERHLTFSEKGKPERKALVIWIFAPKLVDQTSVSFQVAPGTAVCEVDFNGLPEPLLGDTIGADSLQALQFAADIEPVLKRLSERYDFYCPTSEGYFDQ
jgi:hypothetical protein